jgi:putative DNA primase/helicase
MSNKSAAEILRNYRITTVLSAVGRYYAICPQCSTKRKEKNQKLKCLGVTIDEKGVQFGCNHCGWTGGEFYRETARPNRTSTAEKEPGDRPLTPARSKFDRGAAAVNLWCAGADPRGTLAERYLNSRGLELPDDVANRVVRFHDACPWGSEDGETERRPAMLTAFRSIANDRLQAIHRTALAPDGQKIGRMMLGPVGRAAMKIDADENVTAGLTIAEGFESALSGRMLDFKPAWALGSASAVAVFPVLSGIESLTILGETDSANANAVEQCGNRWTDAGREVRVVMSNVGGDVADAWKAGAA